MHARTRLGASLTAAIAGTAMGLGTVAGAAEPPPNNGPNNVQPRPQGPAHGPGAHDPRPHAEEGHGPGAIKVGGKGAATAMNRLLNRDEERVRWCNGVVLPADGLNVRSGPGTGYRKIGTLPHNARVTTDWDTIQRRNGYLWVKLRNGGDRWIADYKTGDGNGKWYVRYSDC